MPAAHENRAKIISQAVLWVEGVVPNIGHLPERWAIGQRLSRQRGRLTEMREDLGPVTASQIKAMIRSSAPQFGQSSGKISSMRTSSSAQAYRAAQLWIGSSAALADALGGLGGRAGACTTGVLTAAPASAVTAERSGECGASTPKRR